MIFADLDFRPVGSSYTCKGIPGFVPKDIDWLAFVPQENLLKVVEDAEEEGYKKDGDYPYNDKWLSMKKKTILDNWDNIILTTDYMWFQRFLEANELCKQLQLVDKEKRIILHKHFLGE